MSKTNKTEEPKQEKVMTKYDRKMQERKKQAEKDKRDNLISKLTAIAVAVVLIGAIVISIGISVSNKHKAVSGVAVQVGDHDITALEYDYYYNVTVANYLNTYSAFLPYMGLDTTKDYDEQPYDETKSWGDVFDEMTVRQIQETKALVDDAKAAGFANEAENEEYESVLSGFSTQAEQAGITLADFYKASFGNYATQDRIEPFIKENLLASAYYNKLLEDNKPTEEEISARYTENTKNYDQVTYELYTFSTEITEESSEKEITVAMEEAKAKAEEKKAALLAGGSDEDRELVENAGYNSISVVYSDWLFDEARQANEVEAFEDESNHRYYVVEFIGRVKPETADAQISGEIASERVNAYKATLLEKYAIEEE